MKYNRFKQIFNDIIFEKSKSNLIEKIANNPHRYIGLFRPTKPKAKIFQNLLQSHEIRFGDAFEKILEEYVKEVNLKILDNHLTSLNGDKLNIDLLFERKPKIYFAEVKIRDDHDSTKKRGQIENFEKKLEALIHKYDEKNLVGFFYFIDPNLTKNKNYYSQELQRMSEIYNVTLHLCYGKKFFELILEGNHYSPWKEINDYLKKWKEEIPEMPEINFDKDANKSFDELKKIPPSIYRKLLDNEEVFNSILTILFPDKKVLKMLKDYFEQQNKHVYKYLAKTLEKKLKQF